VEVRDDVTLGIDDKPGTQRLGPHVFLLIRHLPAAEKAVHEILERIVLLILIGLLVLVVARIVGTHPSARQVPVRILDGGLCINVHHRGFELLRDRREGVRQLLWGRYGQLLGV
jgi:hypothetical protein